MLVNPDKERSPGVWQRTHRLLAWLFASSAKTHAKSELFSGHFPFYRHIVPNGTANTAL